MESARKIAGYVGPMMVALGGSEALNFQIWENSIPALVYLNGSLLLLAGIVILRLHNVWVFNWPILITMTGWALVFAGLYRMFVPQAPQAPAGLAINILFVVLVLAGLLLSYQAYRPSPDDS